MDLGVNLSRLSGREKLLITVLAVALLGIGYYEFILNPLLSERDEFRAHIASMEKRIERNMRLGQREDFIMEKLATFLPTEERDLSLEEKLNKFLTEIEAASTGLVDIIKLNPEAVSGRNPDKIEVSAECVSDLVGLTEFLYKLETSYSLVQVESVRLHPEGKGPLNLKTEIRIAKILVI